MFLLLHSQEVEEQVKERTKADLSGAAKTLCMPFEQPELPEGYLSVTSYFTSFVFQIQ